MRTAKLTLILLVSTVSYASAQLPRPIDRDADRSQILNSLAQISKGYVRRDPGPFEEEYLDNYVSIREKPVYNTKEQLVAMMVTDAAIIKARRKLEYETLSYESENPTIRFFGSTAILNVPKRHYWQYGGLRCLTRLQATELWVKRESGWKIAASHATTFQCVPKPLHPTHVAVAAYPSQTKPPKNADKNSEQQVRDLINSFVRARTTSRELFDALVKEYTAKDFTSVNDDGEVVNDVSVLEMLPASTSARSSGIRGAEEAIVIYDNAAVYTFRLRSHLASTIGAKPKQYTIFFAKVGEKWMIVAAHSTGYGTEQ